MTDAFNTRCVECGEKLVKNIHGVIDHKCDLQTTKPKRKKRKPSNESYCRRLSEGFRMMGKD